jgi:c-di-GMP-binding flagellar brake protein YcgR
MEKGKVKKVSERELKEKLAGDGGGGGGDDRRSNERVPTRLQIEVPLANWDEVRSVYTTNISKGGLLFTLASPASVPAAIDLTLTLPDGAKVTLQSEVRHVARREGTAEFDVGVQFHDLEPATRQALEEALASHP